MSSYAVVLQKGNLVVKASNFGDVVNIKFTKDGKVDEFVYAGKAYYALYQYSSTVFIDYVEKERFSILKKNEIEKEKDKYDGVDISLWRDLIFNQYNALDKAVVNDDIFGVLRDDTGLCFYYYTWKYTDDYKEPIGAVNAFYPPRKADYSCDDFGGNVTATTYYNSLKDQEFYDLETGTSKKDIRLVAEVANLISKVDKQMLDAFDKFTTIVGEHGEFKIIDNPTNTYTRSVLLGYRDGLKKWLQLYEKYKNELKKLDDPAQLYIICDILYRYNMLGTLTVDQKISILLTFCTKPLMDWYFVNFKDGFQQRETLVVRVIDSVRNDQSSEFLSKLINTKLFLIKPSYYLSALPLGSLISTPQFTEMNLYRVLFKKIDDYFGPDNFTTFIKTLQRLVLAKNGIILPNKVNKIDYELDELKAKTDKLFMWGNIRNENKVKYSVKKKNNENIVFVERICSKINRVEIQNSNSLGIPTNNSFTVAICDDYVEKEIEVKHFDLVAIAFFDNPSFIDLGEATSFVDQRFLTFGGFVDYLLEKENTKLVEKVIVAGLTVLSMAIGVGEIVAFMRGASYLRLLAGIGILAGDTSAYLAQDTAFRNYIIQKYPRDYNTILTLMSYGGLVLSLGGTSVVGSGILKTYSASEAAEFIGIGKQVLADAEALSKLTVNERNILENGIKIFENGLYRIKYEPELAKTVNRARTTIKFNDNIALRTEIFALEESDRLRFLDDFYDASIETTQLLKDNPGYINKWLNFTEQEKRIAKINQLSSIEKEVNASLRFQKLYVRPDGLLPKIGELALTEKYGPHAVSLVNKVENKAQALISTIKRKILGKNEQLVSAMADKEEGVISDVFTNFTLKELDNGTYSDFINNGLHPNLKLRYNLTMDARNAGRYNMLNPDHIKYTGLNMAAHAEVRALNHLALETWGNTLIDPYVFDSWLKNNVLGYNRNIVTKNIDNIIMPPCADCFYLTDLVTFIK
ncbi:hypothetical protein [Pedobacter sp. KLB.chiD]|uniref:hypothetical protein n=1 Tax=Pedobacter sp. KLB.chiD TaxID=3387402 RepID=UPI00399A9555